VIYQAVVNKHIIREIERSRAKKLGYEVGKLRKAARQSDATEEVKAAA
jgi:hypothetical protein